MPPRGAQSRNDGVLLLKLNRDAAEALAAELNQMAEDIKAPNGTGEHGDTYGAPRLNHVDQCRVRFLHRWAGELGKLISTEEQAPHIE